MTRYTIYVTPAALKEIKRLPGHIRQRVRRTVGALAGNLRPGTSKALDVSGVPCEVRRLRLERWRVVYAITDAEQVVDILAVRKRPPYDYRDLKTLLKDYPSD